MSTWVQKERFGLPGYLLRTCPSSLREGRRLKTKFRLGCHDLRSSSSRTQLVRNAQCPCCKSRESETIQHALLECSAFTKERDTFLERFYELHPIARGLSPEGLCDVLMSDDLPHETEISASLAEFLQARFHNAPAASSRSPAVPLLTSATCRSHSLRDMLLGHHSDTTSLRVKKMQ